MSPRIAVVGCGQWGQNHIRTLAEIGALAAVADRNPDRATAFSEQYGVPALAPEVAIASPDIDALVLALPASVHGVTARAAFAAGKDVLIEKPIALDPADAERTAFVVEEIGELGIPVMFLAAILLWPGPSLTTAHPTNRAHRV